ncbi:RBR-type E3 ubiquitin transferase [Aphelenchoides fujianensis]|nr:RBR-type E3 ubiquitin transferase [Aphelenchoides fujianensis]
MSVKGNRTKNLGTLVECAENGDDSAAPAGDAADEAADAQTNGADGRSSHYETASSKFSTADEPPAECATSRTDVPSPSESADVSITRHMRNPSDSTISKSRSDTSPNPRKASTADSSSSSDSSVDLRTAGKLKPKKRTRFNRGSTSSASSTNKQRFSFATFLNNVTAPVRKNKEEKPSSSSNSSLKNEPAGLPPPKSRKFTKRDLRSSHPEMAIAALLEAAEHRTRPEVSVDHANPFPPRGNFRTSSHSADNIGSFRQRYMDSLTNDGAESADLIECPVCCVLQPARQYPPLTNCAHRTCRTCLENYLQIEIMESRVVVNCTECSAPIHPNDIYAALCMNTALLERYERFMIRRVLMTDPDTRWCPAPDCDYAVIAQSCAACPQLECGRPGCNTLFCYHCKGEWHPQQTCDEARGKSAERMFASAASALSAATGGSGGATAVGVLNALSGSSGSSAEKAGDLKACPRCHTLIVKLNDGSCNHMVCPLCQADFCWLCLKEISDLHYLSPTGCTFWGKKPWTRKKKLLWQIGTLIGAPVGIALIAGLAVPGIICGVPVFVGRKVYQRFAHQSRARRRLITAASVAGSLIVSPVLAVMAVGVGVPIMLAYIYGVVPLSLCRNGGCGGSDQADSAALAEAAAAAATAAFSEETASPSRQTEDSARGLGSSTNGARFPFAGDENVRLLRHARRDDRATSPDDVQSFAVVEKHRSSGRGHRKHTSQPDVISASSSSKLAGPSDSQRRRKLSAESYANSLGERLNYDNASTKANAGSHYQFDSKSVHTVGSGAEAQSYCEEVASVQAACGSIADSASVRMPRQQRTNSRPERDLSPSSINSLGDSRSLIINKSPQPAVDFASLPNEQQPAGGELFRFRTFMDNLRQILNDDVAEEEGAHEVRLTKRNPKTPKSHHGSVSDVNQPAAQPAASTAVAAKVRYDQNSRALSVQMPAATAAAVRRSMPALNRPEPAAATLTLNGTVLAEATEIRELDAEAAAPQAAAKRSRQQRVAAFFRSFRSNNSEQYDVERQARRNKKAPAV